MIEGKVQKAGFDQIPGIAATLARAFDDDPVFAWALPNRARRSEALPRLFGRFTRRLFGHNETYAARDAGGAIASAALWEPVGLPAATGGADDTTDVEPLEQAAGPGAERLFEVFDLLDRHAPQSSCQYLHILGTAPEHRGRGLGSAVMAPVLEGCDRDAVRAYLIATGADSKRLYERHGFRAVDEFSPRGGPPLWPMWREPERAGGSTLK